MENSSNMSDASDKVKGILTNMKSPLKHNLSKINDILDLFDKSTVALLNPIKKLKISAAAKFEDLMELERKGKEADKQNETKDENCIKEGKNIQEPKDIKESEKYAQIVEDFSNRISILNELLNTEEFKQLTNFSSNLNSNKKKANKDPLTLNLNEDHVNNINAFKPIKSIKNKSSSKSNKREVELSPNPENNAGEKNVFDDIFNNEENESLTKSYNSDLDDELNLKQNTKKNIGNNNNNINNNNKIEASVKASKNKKPSSKNSRNSSNKTLNSKAKGSKNGSLLKKKTKRSSNGISNNNSKSKAKALNSSKKLGSSGYNNSNKTSKRPNEQINNNINNFNINLTENAKSFDSSAEAENINAIINKRENEEKENNSDEEKDENTPGRRLTDEECLEKMKEKLPNDKGLTKTFITRKLRKKVMVTRSLDYTRFEATVKNVENSIPKKSGPNNFIKFSVKTTSEDELKLNSNLLYFLKDLFITHFIVFKNKENVKKIVVAGSINKDIIHFLKRIATLEFKEKYHVLSAKVKAYAFYEELVHEFTQRKDVVSKNLTSDDIDGLLKQYEYLSHMRNCYEEIKKIRIVE